ncbi:MAG: VCBS repeat-containing protein [Cellulophaga sp.]
MKNPRYTLLIASVLLILSCSKKTQKPETLYELMDAKQTGIDFRNDLIYNQDFNVYTYRNFYNGGGVAIGDINNDGLIDLYLTSNQNSNKLYLNKGDFKFEDITEKSNVGGSKAWSTGITMVDINSDGFLDIYVCNSGDVEGDNKQNELFINNGDLSFTESAELYGLADLGFSTHASFFDFDKDGDLDVYLLNNSYQAIGSFNLRKNERPKRDVLGGDKLMENVNGKFLDISEKAGIYGSVIGFGLGVSVGDLNGDDWDDIYVSNDFFEHDYLYINQQDGTFKESLTTQIKSTSGASMGADLADINNDGHNEIFVTEMLPSEYTRLKTVTTFEDWNKYQYNVKNGYYHQFTRNTLQLNNANSTFSEVGRFSGVEASDWSWGGLFFDMDNDGAKDLFIANGIYKDLTNQDYLLYISNDEIVKSIVANNEINYKRLIDIIPTNEVKNHAYKNIGNLKFERDLKSGLNTPSFSNGSAYGDFDNDGDLDLVVNNVNMPIFFYKNNTEVLTTNHYLKLVLKGEGANKNAIGAKIKVSTSKEQQYLEQQPVRGFQSSMDQRPNFGLKTDEAVTVSVKWPSGKYTTVTGVKVDQILTLHEKEAKILLDAKKENTTPLFEKSRLTIDFKHIENRFVDFNRDRLLHQMYSTEGPKVAMGDIDNDGKEDLFIGSSKGNTPTILLGNDTSFMPFNSPVFEKNKSSEDTGSLFFDADNDGDLDLYVCSGGVEFSQFSSNFLDRLYFNDGKGNFSLSNQKLPAKKGYFNTGTVISSDIDKDGDLDLFIGERSIPGKYGIPGSGFILENDGKGNFSDVTEHIATDLKHLGMITDALFIDLNNDDYEDLVVVGEYMGIEFFINEKGSFVKRENNSLSNLKGWWNTIHKADLNNDGKLDLIVGNHGLNSRFKANTKNPIQLFLKDFDKNGFLDPILTFKADNGKNYPYALRHNLIDQIKSLKKIFPNYESFKDAGIKDIFTTEQLEGVLQVEANTLASVVLINKGGFNFSMEYLPFQAQLSPIYAIATHDFDNDGDQDIVLGGNLYNVKPEAGRYDATYGVYLENLGNMKFQSYKDGKGFSVDGQIRDLVINNNKLIVTRNSDSLVIFKY